MIDEATTTELQAPWRIGHGRLIRLPFTGHRPTMGLIIGRWGAAAAPWHGGAQADKGAAK